MNNVKMNYFPTSPFDAGRIGSFSVDVEKVGFMAREMQRKALIFPVCHGKTVYLRISLSMFKLSELRRRKYRECLWVSQLFVF